MSSLITCNNKGCYTQDFHKLDLDSNNVFCIKCNKEIEVNLYIKKVLKSSGQVFRKVETAVRYACPHCKVSDTPVLLEYGRGVYDVCCAHCGKVNNHLTNFFVEPLRLNDSVPRIKVKVVETDGVETVVQSDDSLLPWLAKGEGKSITPAQTKADDKSKERERQRAAKLVRVEADRIRDAAANAVAHAAVLAEQESRKKKVAGAGQRARPVSPSDMLKRVGIANLNGEDPDTEETDSPRRPVIKSSAGKSRPSAPMSPADILKRAGVRNLADDSEEEGEELDE